MNKIMPQGYSKAATRKRLIEQLTKARAQELASANASDQERIHQAIATEVESKLIEL